LSTKYVFLDVTSWVRGPQTSVGLCARRLRESLAKAMSLESAMNLQAVSRNSLPKNKTSTFKGVDVFGWKDKFFGFDGIYHSVDPVLPRVKKSKRVMTVHDCWTLWENPYQSADFQKNQRKKFIRSLGRADHIVTPTDHVRKQLVAFDKNLEGRVTVIPWGPLLDYEQKFNEGAVQGPPYASVVEAYLAKKRPYFLCVANFEVRKNHSLLFRAIEKLPDVDLILVGGKGFGWEEVEKERQALCHKVPTFWFHDLDTQELAKLYKNSLALVQPSFDEGFGLPVCEALKFQKPLVLSQINAFYEIAGNAALYFHPIQGEAELTRYLRDLADDVRLRDSWAAKTLQRQHLFSWELTARAHIKLYRDL
jgi:glycosyltransferase involved in cell wall biosynthesis